MNLILIGSNMSIINFAYKFRIHIFNIVRKSHKCLPLQIIIINAIVVAIMSCVLNSMSCIYILYTSNELIYHSRLFQQRSHQKPNNNNIIKRKSEILFTCIWLEFCVAPLAHVIFTYFIAMCAYFSLFLNKSKSLVLLRFLAATNDEFAEMENVANFSTEY